MKVQNGDTPREKDDQTTNGQAESGSGVLSLDEGKSNKESLGEDSNSEMEIESALMSGSDSGSGSGSGSGEKRNTIFDNDSESGSGDQSGSQESGSQESGSGSGSDGEDDDAVKEDEVVDVIMPSTVEKNVISDAGRAKRDEDGLDAQDKLENQLSIDNFKRDLNNTKTTLSNDKEGSESESGEESGQESGLESGQESGSSDVEDKDSSVMYSNSVEKRDRIIKESEDSEEEGDENDNNEPESEFESESGSESGSGLRLRFRKWRKRIWRFIW